MRQSLPPPPFRVASLFIALLPALGWIAFVLLGDTFPHQAEVNLEDLLGEGLNAILVLLLILVVSVRGLPGRAQAILLAGLSLFLLGSVQDVLDELRRFDVCCAPLLENAGVPLGMALSGMGLALLLHHHRRLIRHLDTERSHYEELSNRDGLTGLYNRRFGERHLQAMMASHGERRRPLSVLMLDVDDFKHINDTLGHLRGDQVLCEVAQRIRWHLRENDLVFRYGGEEFVIALDAAAPDEAWDVAQRIGSAVACSPLQPERNDPARVTLSIGLVQQQADESWRTLLHRADQALYEAKAQGKNRVVRA